MGSSGMQPPYVLRHSPNGDCHALRREFLRRWQMDFQQVSLSQLGTTAEGEKFLDMVEEMYGVLCEKAFNDLEWSYGESAEDFVSRVEERCGPMEDMDWVLDPKTCGHIVCARHLPQVSILVCAEGYSSTDEDGYEEYTTFTVVVLQKQK